MATRWRAGEESLIAGNREYFCTYSLDEGSLIGDVCNDLGLHEQLDAGEALQSLQVCLDPSILSIFEDSTAVEEAKGRLDEEGEAALLTALTDILDNVDGENLSPFDTLPDSELLSGQKGREPSPLRRLLSLARSPEKDPVRVPKSSSSMGNELDVCFERHMRARPLSMASQRSDGEEEEDTELGDFMQGPEGSQDLPSLDVMELGELMSTEQPSSLYLGELVKQMHPYCLAVSLELGESGEQLPEGGIMLEVVDRDERGEPILAVTSPLPQVPEVEDGPDGRALNTGAPDFPPAVEDQGKVVSEERPREQTSDKCPSRRKKKRKSKSPAPGAEKQTRGSAPVKQAPEVSSAPEKEPDKNSQRMSKKKRVTFAPVLTSVLNGSLGDEQEAGPQVDPIHPVCQMAESVPPLPAVSPVVNEKPVAVGSQEPAATQQEEPRPKPLSLHEYRLLRQQMKPAPVEKSGDSSAKWPTVPEPPKELPPIPCLAEQRRAFHSATKVEPENFPAWRPVGSGIPPTPEALLMPPSSVTSSSKSAAVPASASNATGGLQVQNKAPAAAVTASAQNPARCDGTFQAPRPLTTRAAPIPSQPEACQVPPRPATKLSPIGVHPQSQLAPAVQTTTSTTQQPQSARLSSSKAQEAKPEPCPNRGPASTMAAQPTAAVLPAHGRPQRVDQNKLLKPLPEGNPTVASQALNSDIGIEATDLTSLLEQFEETQAKEEQTVPEVCGKAAAVGNSGKPMDRMVVPDLASTAGLTPPATPPHPTWKPLAPVALLGKSKPSSQKSIQIINPRPLPPSRARSKPTQQVVAPTQHPAFADHDYCLATGAPEVMEHTTRAGTKQPQPGSDIQPAGGASSVVPQRAVPSGLTAQPLDHRTRSEPKAAPLTVSVLLSPSSSPCGEEINPVTQEGGHSRSGGTAYCSSRRSEGHAVHKRGRTQQRYRARSPSSASSSSSSRSRSRSSSESPSRSFSPPRKRFRSRSRRSESSSSSSSSCSSSCSPSPPRRRCGSYSSSRSRSWSRSHSRSRSRSRSPCWRRNGRSRSPNYTCTYHYESRDRFHSQEVKDRKQKAIEERRVVYVGKIRSSMTRKELKERFSQYGEIEDCTLHFREHGDNYGFVTYYKTKDAFDAIENGSKLRQCNELPFDLCFGGRRQFCKTSYADLDSSRDYEPTQVKSKFDALDFDTLLRQAQKGLKR